MKEGLLPLMPSLMNMITHMIRCNSFQTGKEDFCLKCQYILMQLKLIKQKELHFMELMEREKGPIEQDSYDMILNPSHNVPHFDYFAPLLNQS